jgi:hypothetical protein
LEGKELEFYVKKVEARKKWFLCLTSERFDFYDNFYK